MIERYLSPAELKRLLSALLVVVLFLCLLMVFAFLVLPGLRNANAPAAEQSSRSPGPVPGVSGWLDPTDYPPERGRTVPPIDPATVMTPNPDLLARGKALFTGTCASCHGVAGNGDGPAGKGLNPPPRRFTQPEGWTNGYRITGIFKTLAEGVPGSSMVSYSYLSKRDRMALVHYVRSLGSFDHGAEDPKALADLTHLFASAGEVIPNRIPVPMAMVRLEQEAVPVPPLQLASPLVPPPGSAVLAAAVTDPARAARTLAGHPGWAASDRALAEAIVPGLPGDGFAPAVALYSDPQWQELRTELGRALQGAGHSGSKEDRP